MQTQNCGGSTVNEPTSNHDDLAGMLAIADGQPADAARRVEPDERFIYGVWGAAWLIGFVAQWLTAGDDPRVDAAAASDALFTTLIVVAIVVNIVHIARRVRGLHGPTAVMGQRYSITWGLAFATYGAVLVGLGNAGASDEMGDLVAPLLACFIVALLYMAGGAAWNDRLQFVVGAWIAGCVAVGSLLGSPWHLLVLGVAGGGGLLAAAAMTHRRSAVAIG
jgi:hypothetical protein